MFKGALTFWTSKNTSQHRRRSVQGASSKQLWVFLAVCLLCCVLGWHCWTQVQHIRASNETAACAVPACHAQSLFTSADIDRLLLLPSSALLPQLAQLFVDRSNGYVCGDSTARRACVFGEIVHACNHPSCYASLQVIDILMAADLSEEARMRLRIQAGDPAGSSTSRAAPTQHSQRIYNIRSG